MKVYEDILDKSSPSHVLIQKRTFRKNMTFVVTECMIFLKAIFEATVGGKNLAPLDSTLLAACPTDAPSQPPSLILLCNGLESERFVEPTCSLGWKVAQQNRNQY